MCVVTLGTRVKSSRKDKADHTNATQVNITFKKNIHVHISKADSVQSFFSNPLYLCYQNFTFTSIAFIEFRFSILCALKPCAQRGL